MFARDALVALELSTYWTLMVSSLMAAFAGIAWYLIFMRWSYRHTFGRGAELDQDTQIVLDDGAITLSRGQIEIRIGWPALHQVHEGRGYIAVYADGTDPIIIPHRWFGGDRDRRARFLNRLRSRTEEGA